MNTDIVLEEREAWWCRECESIVRILAKPGRPMGIFCDCSEPLRDIADIPDKWVSCVVRVMG